MNSGIEIVYVAGRGVTKLFDCHGPRNVYGKSLAPMVLHEICLLATYPPLAGNIPTETSVCPRTRAISPKRMIHPTRLQHGEGFV